MTFYGQNEIFSDFITFQRILRSSLTCWGLLSEKNAPNRIMVLYFCGSFRHVRLVGGPILCYCCPGISANSPWCQLYFSDLAVPLITMENVDRWFQDLRFHGLWIMFIIAHIVRCKDVSHAVSKYFSDRVAKLFLVMSFIGPDNCREHWNMEQRHENFGVLKALNDLVH